MTPLVEIFGKFGYKNMSVEGDVDVRYTPEADLEVTLSNPDDANILREKVANIWGHEFGDQSALKISVNENGIVRKDGLETRCYKYSTNSPRSLIVSSIDTKGRESAE